MIAAGEFWFLVMLLINLTILSWIVLRWPDSWLGRMIATIK